MILGTINTVDNINGLKVQIDGEDSPTTKKYSYLASYVPVAGDRVLIEEVGGSYVILGKIITELSKSGIVRQADQATSATSAQTANSATSAGTAGYATSAGTADNLNDNNYGTAAGALVTQVSQQYNSQIGYYIAAITTTQGANIVYKK